MNTPLTVAEWFLTLTPLVIGPITYYLVQALIAARTHLGLQTTAQDRANMETEIHAAIGAGLAVAPQIITDGIVTQAALKDVVNAAAIYMHQRFPDRVAQIVAAAPDDDITPLAALRQT